MGFLIRLGIQRGLLGGSKFFASLGLVAVLFNLIQKLSGNAPKTLYTHELKPGETLVVSEFFRSSRNK